jgi:D-glycero-alpha-D-manno-heptose-7-phosphate kinase
MIITATPLRVSFLGGGTDYPEHFSEHGGATLAASIDQYTYITVTRLTEFFDHRLRVSYSRTELCREVDEIQHPSVRQCLKFTGIESGVEIAVVSDLPARTGLGSSSCFTVGLLHALHAFQGHAVDQRQLAREAVHIERDLIGERVGLQDQYACALGGLLHLRFSGQNQVAAAPLLLPPQRLEALQQRLMLFYTGLQRSAHEVVKEQLDRTRGGAITPQLYRLRQLAQQGVQTLTDGDLTEFGELLHDGWMLKRALSGAISNPMIDQAYDRARRSGAIGGKLLGAGGGGFLLVYAEPARQPAVRAALQEMREVHFRFDAEGTRVIYRQSASVAKAALAA